jgi:hypothetical protein
MSNIHSNNTRKIKCFGNSVETNEFYLHPITLALSRNDSSKRVCPTELHYKDGKPYYAMPSDENKLSNMDIQRFMALPYLNLNLGQMLQIYGIVNVDDMVRWVDMMIEADKPYNYIKRIFNIWIHYNLDDLKENNKIIYSLIKKITKHYKINLKNDTEKNINEWIKKKDLNDFNFDILGDL